MKIYKSHNTLFLPTREVVQFDFLNGKKGEKLWAQMIDGSLCGNLWTEKQIMCLDSVISVTSEQLLEGVELIAENA